MKSIKSTLVFAVILVLMNIVGCSNTLDIKSADAVIAGDRPAMWLLSDSDSEIYLFGTFHLLPPETQWQSVLFDTAMLNTKNTYLEADTTSPQALAELQQAIQHFGLNPPGVTLTSLLGDERAREFSVVAQEFGIAMTNLEMLRPWLASLTVTIAAFQYYGLDQDSGADMTIEKIATSQGDDILYLERANSQIEMLASLDDIKDYATFDEGLDQLENFEAEIQSMITAWSIGDTKMIEQQVVKSIKDISHRAYTALFETRNENWTLQISELMKGSENYFIAVGAGHLVGKQSVINMLQREGFSVVRVQ